MRQLIDKVTGVNRDHLIDTIGELKAPVLDRDLGGSMRHITAINVSNAAHTDLSEVFEADGEDALHLFDDVFGGEQNHTIAGADHGI